MKESTKKNAINQGGPARAVGLSRAEGRPVDPCRIKDAA